MPASIFLEGSPEPAVGEAGAGTMPSGLRGSGLGRSGPRGQTSDKGAALGEARSPAAHTPGLGRQLLLPDMSLSPSLQEAPALEEKL